MRRFGKLRAARSLPAAVLGPVLEPPWFRHRFFPGKGRARQGVPLRVVAPQRVGVVERCRLPWNVPATGAVAMLVWVGAAPEPHDARACIRAIG